MELTNKELLILEHFKQIIAEKAIAGKLSGDVNDWNLDCWYMKAKKEALKILYTNNYKLSRR